MTECDKVIIMESTINNLFREPAIMPNNLDAIIRASGMNKKQVAKAAGMTPEALSRHIHGHVNMTLENAERYAEILGVSVQKIMFVNPPTPIVGEAILQADDIIVRNFLAKWTQGVQIRSYLGDDICAVKYTAEPGYKGYWYEYTDALCFYLKKPILEHFVDKGCVQNPSLVMLEDEIKLPNQEPTRLIAGVVYPEPGNLYTIDSPKNGINLRGLKLVWGTPYISALFRPDLRGVTYVDIECEHSDCKECNNSYSNS